MRPLLLPLTIAAVALAACSPADEAPAAAGTQAAASAGAGIDLSATGPVSRKAIYAASAEGPEPFVRALYAQFVNGGLPGEPPAPGQDPLFSSRMNAVIVADMEAAKGEVPTLNYDPFCGCQDQGDFAVTALAVAQAGAGAADATVAFTNMGEPKTLTLKLVREGSNWKVDDIVDGGVSLHDTLAAVAQAAG